MSKETKKKVSKKVNKNNKKNATIYSSWLCIVVVVLYVFRFLYLMSNFGTEFGNMTCAFLIPVLGLALTVYAKLIDGDNKLSNWILGFIFIMILVDIGFNQMFPFFGQF